jgi:Cof subfamily protein (haloacid dehalogenase superfamily)
LETIKLVASDLDGTMLDSSGKIPERNLRAVAEAMRAGVTVTISTGRMYGSAATFARRLGLGNTPILCYNGAMISNEAGETAMHLKLDIDVAREMLAIFRERGIYVQSYIDDVLYVESSSDRNFLDYQKHFGIMGKAIGDSVFDPQTPPTKLLIKTNGFEASRALMKEFSERFAGRAYVTSSSEDFVEMMNPAVDKGKCLIKLADILGVSMKNVMALGDGDNDVTMIECAGLGIAMANARDETKSYAREIAPSNDECGVAWAIEKFVLSPASQGEA